MKILALETEAAQTPPNHGLCFAQHLLRMLQAQHAAARQDLLRAAAVAPMHGACPGCWRREAAARCVPSIHASHFGEIFQQGGWDGAERCCNMGWAFVQV